MAAESTLASYDVAENFTNVTLENGSNKTKIFCPACGSLILSKKNARRVEIDVSISNHSINFFL